MKSLCTTTKSSPRSPQLEKACTQQQRPNAAKKEKTDIVLITSILSYKDSIYVNYFIYKHTKLRDQLYTPDKALQLNVPTQSYIVQDTYKITSNNNSYWVCPGTKIFLYIITFNLHNIFIDSYSYLYPLY